uniref:Uncharacterized protein n=1 Tax=Timema tahoe TaxID=61484 RepID=A0A7R9P0Y1_9NEOP|nr:unnamed protein product [Timema tahoe]
MLVNQTNSLASHSRGLEAESDFISEWLVQLHPHIPSIITSGVGVSVFGRSIWIWEGSEQPFSFTKWWTGWTNNVHVPPSTKDRPLCVEARRLFPCQHPYYSSAEDGSLCGANYFYWDIEDCAVSHTHPYICEKPHLDIGCVAGVGQEYAGAANVTINGMPCIHWDLEEVVPYLRFKVSEAERTMSLTGHNYCRNVGGTEGHPWCFVGPRGMMELCDIPTCFSSGAKQTSANTSRCGPKQFECAPAECIASAWVCDGEKDCSNGHDEQSCTGYLEEFSYHGSKRLEGHNVEKWLHTDVNTCAKHCLEALEFTCLSFSFQKLRCEFYFLLMSSDKMKSRYRDWVVTIDFLRESAIISLFSGSSVSDRDGVCLLSDSNVGLTGHLRQLQEWEYYELKSKSIHCDNNFTCDNQKCISASSTRVSRGRKKVGESVPATLVAVEQKDVPAT